MQLLTRNIAVMVLTYIQLLGPVQADAQEPFQWAEQFVSNFDRYCFSTDADYQSTVSIADEQGLDPIPAHQLPELMPPTPPKQGSGYQLALDEDAEVDMILLTVAGTDACTISSSGIDQGLVVALMRESYSLMEVQRIDFPRRITTVYVPEGTTGDFMEGGEKGFVNTVININPFFEVITITYLPPRSLKELWSQLPTSDE
ncbi:hypothetical protein HNO51_03125 [Billgrantia sulfidoxydans]|uniref:Uncharacterized protein n=1 Tax=Billgrantia sulfidoxydans TaxID=2733484 RepID=A0ABX7W436_9GAMM|nr:hypothetical protein [Halomonas sulfidoxydans]QTP53758.1 hypothetical protein HNO51_03125 [Halomonas sulfidoxydans]